MGWPPGPTLGPRNDGVTLATLHRAKGLEWEVVFVVGVTDGAIPSTYATTTQERAEEERLLHVGVTRARRELHLTWPSTNARGWTNRPSPLLDLLPTRRTQERRPSATPKGSAPLARKKRSPAIFSGTGTGTGSSRGSTCPHCTDPLKGSAARTRSACALDCVNERPRPHRRREPELSPRHCQRGVLHHWDTGRSADEPDRPHPPASDRRPYHRRPGDRHRPASVCRSRWASKRSPRFSDE